MGDSAYSFSLTTFSRTGKLLQIEYALNAVANGRTSLGICTKDGVVIATDKKLASPLVDTAHVHKIEAISPSTGFVYSGVGPDYRVLGMPACMSCCQTTCRVLYSRSFLIYTHTSSLAGFLVAKARKSSQAYARMYGETQPVSQLVKQTAGVMQEYTQSGGVRPFGISVLVAGSDGDGTPRLYQVDPSGAYFGWKATAIGKVSTNIGMYSSIVYTYIYTNVVLTHSLSLVFQKELRQCQVLFGKAIFGGYGIGRCHSYGSIDIERRI
jgi:20S proteasome subunit alpha 2